jgi:hypothetical protein
MSSHLPPIRHPAITSPANGGKVGFMRTVMSRRTENGAFWSLIIILSGTGPLRKAGRNTTSSATPLANPNYRHTKPEFVPFPTETYPKNPVGPDELDPGNLHNLKNKDKTLIVGKFIWPDAHVVPFHYRKLNFTLGTAG